MKIATAFVGGCADFFNLEIPYIGITFFQLFGALLILRAIIAGIKIIFGTDKGGDSA